MSDKERKRSIDDEHTRINQDEGSKIAEIITEDNVSLDSNKNIGNGDALCGNMPIKEPGHDKSRDLQNNMELGKVEADLTEMSKKIVNTDEGTGAGDYSVQEMDSGTDYAIAEKDKSSDTYLDKCVKIDSEKADDLEEIEDMELRWDEDDDDDPSNEEMNVGDKNTSLVDDTQSEDQLLKELSDVLNDEETPSDVNPKVSETDLDNVNSEENSLTRDDVSKEIETTRESKISPKPVIPTDKKISVDKYYNLNTEPITSPEMDFSAEESMDRDDINVKDKLLKESEIVTEAALIARAKVIHEEKSMDEPIQEGKEVTLDEQATDDPADIIEEDQHIVESVSNTETEPLPLKLESCTDAILNKDNDDVMSEENLLKDTDSKGESSLIISEKDIEPFIKVPTKGAPMNEEDDDVMSEENLLKEPNSKGESSLIISEKDVEPFIKVPTEEAPINEEDNDDALLEERLLLETETDEVTPESNITMDVDDEEEGELLKEDEGQEDGHAPMEVDNTDTSIGEQPKVEDEVIDQTINQSEVAKKSLPLDDQTNTEKVDTTTEEIKVMEQSDDQSKIIEQDDDQPIKDTTKTAYIIKDKPIESEAKIDEKITDQDIAEKETVDRDQLILETNTKESSVGPVETDALTTSNTPNILAEGPTNTISEINTLEKEIQNKRDPEKLKEIAGYVNKDIDLDKPETSKRTVNSDTILDKNKEVDEISHDNSSMFLDDSCCIKTDHGVHKPDVMLEIPTQELIDMDDMDLSMNLDHSEVIDGVNDDKNFDDDDVQDKTIDTTAIDDITVSHNIATNDTTAGEKSLEQTKTDEDAVKQESVDQAAIAIESTVSEVQSESERVEIIKTAADTVVEATVEQTMERLFADDEPEVAKEIAECTVSTSQTQVPTELKATSMTRMTPDTSNEVPEIDDSLGLLAESAGRMMEDDDDPDEDFDADDDDDSDHDESSNQISPEQSEDSNQAALEPEPVKDQEDKDLETPDPKDDGFPFNVCDSTSQDKADKMDVDEEYGTIELHAETINEMNEETQSAVDALLNADNPPDEQVENQQQAIDQMDIDTVRLSDTSDNDIDVEATEVQQAVAGPSKEVEEKENRSRSKSPSKSNISPKQTPSKLSQSPSKASPSKMQNFAITTQTSRTILNIVDLEESSSSEDDIQEVQKETEPEAIENKKSPSPESDVTNVKIPTGIDIMCTSGGNTSEITTNDNLSQVVISGVPKPPPHKPTRLNTSEVSIKTVSNTEPLIIPETMINEPNQTPKPRLSLEIFSLDSDDDESVAKEKSPPTSPKIAAVETEKARETSKCINYCCKSDNKVPYVPAEASVVAYYDPGKKRRAVVCQPCADVVAARTKSLIKGIKDLTPLLELDMGKLSQDLVEISDSESEDEDMSPEEPKESIGEKGAKFVEDNLAKFLNDTWIKYDMDLRLKETQIMLDDEIEKLEQDSKEIDTMLNECQVATDKLRCELYATFECRRQKLPPVAIIDTPDSQYIGLENLVNQNTNSTAAESIESRQAKRRLSSANAIPAKRPAIPLGYAPLGGGDSTKEKATIPGPDNKQDDDKDISVVKLSVEAAPADLPPPGEISRPPLRVGMPVYAMKNAFGPWLKGRVAEMQPKNSSGGNPYSVCLVKFDHKIRTNGKILQARCIAYAEPADVRMTIGTRLIALFKDSTKRESYYSGVVAEIPNPVNNYRYLVFFDDGYAQYVQHQHTRLVCESSSLVWEEVHPFSRQFVRDYLMSYPERPMVRLHEGQHLKTEWNGKWWSARVTRVDAALAQVMFVNDGRREWIYRGSTRLAPLYLELQAAERHRARPMPRSKAQPKSNMPYVEYTRSDEPESAVVAPPADVQTAQPLQQEKLAPQPEIQNEEIRRQRAVARKSTSALPQVLPPTQQITPPKLSDPFTSRVVYYTPKNAVKPLKMVPHKCGPRCKRSDVLSLKELRTYNPLAKPLLSGWERQIVRYKGHREVMYRAPCGRRLRNMRELHNYLRTIDSDLPVDLFDFQYTTHCLAEYVMSKSVVGKRDLSHGKENVPVPCVNYYDDSLPDFCTYDTARTATTGVPLNIDAEFLCGCDCTDDCQDKSKCACWKLTLEGARTIGLRGPNVGYVYKRLPEPLPSGIYECNSRCKCKRTCLNRVAQHPLQLKLQVFKTPNRGWGIRALNDVPKGAFLCVYAGNLLTDATANLDGLTEGDEYLAELDYIEVVEQMKEGYEEDIPEADKKLDKKGSNDGGESSDEDEPSSSEDEETTNKTDKEDDDFRPGYIGLDVTEFNSKRLRKREKSKKEKENTASEEKEKEKEKEKDNTKDPNAEDDCITISDDEEVREPSRFMAETNMGATEYVSKYKSVRTLFGEDESCYIMDAKVQGNIGRYLNHSCCPNVFVQNVFVDTHDPRFPWVAFFALSHIKAGTELTWNYNYDVGSVPGKILYCLCGADNCRGRLL